MASIAAAGFPLSREALRRISIRKFALRMSSTAAGTSEASVRVDTVTSAPHSNFGDYVSGPTTHFGYEDVSVEAKEGRVREVFESVADNYDIMNDLMSAGMHRLWKDELLSTTGVGPAAKALRRAAARKPTSPTVSPLLSVLDVAGGTGDEIWTANESDALRTCFGTIDRCCPA